MRETEGIKHESAKLGGAKEVVGALRGFGPLAGVLANAISGLLDPLIKNRSCTGQ